MYSEVAFFFLYMLYYWVLLDPIKFFRKKKFFDRPTLKIFKKLHETRIFFLLGLTYDNP